LVALGVFGAVFGQAFGQALEPIETRNQRAYSLLFLRLPPLGPLLSYKDSVFNLTFSGANDYFLSPKTLVNPVIKEKIEMDRLNLHYERGLGRGFQIGGELAVEDLGGGFMDSTIRWYHHAIVNLHDIRDAFPNGAHVLLSPAGGPFSGGVGLGDLSLYAHYGLPGTARLVGVGLKLPTGNTGAILGSGGVDFGIDGQWDFRLAPRWTALLQAGAVWQGRATVLRGARSQAWQQALVVQWQRNSRDAWLAQFQRESSGLDMGVPISDQVHATATLGYRRALGAGRSLTFFFSENVDLLNPNLPNGDGVGNIFTVGASLSWRP
jgi:hypothetical protein